MQISRKKILAIIPARGGSKLIPRKNIKLFAGKPLIAWSIETAIKSKVLDRIIVSTDDKEIAEISKKFGAEIPFIRPKKLACDTAPTLPVLQHAVSFFKKEEYNPDYILLLEPTSPCRQPFHIQEAVKILKETDADSIVALGEVPKHFNFNWQFELNGNKLRSCTGKDIRNIIRRRQDLPQTYFRNGVFYLFKTDFLFSSKPSMYGKNVRGYVIDEKYSADIDNLKDWELAEKKFKLLQSI